MSEENEDFDTENDIFDLDMSDVVENNKRTAIRYVRHDISVTLIKKGLLKSNEIMVQLIDVSSKGVLISCSYNLAVKKKVVLNLIFKDGKRFSLPATVIYVKNSSSKKQYGLKFNVRNDDLGEYLLSSQSDLIFK